MFSGFYTIASGMYAQQRNMDVIGNNLVNTQTPGYHADRMVISTFERELALRQENNNNTRFGVSGALATIVDGTLPIFKQGDIKQTDRAFDIAINGDGYFNIEGADGQQYLTRCGQFDVDEEGNLILPGVGTVQGEDGPLLVEGSKLQVDSTGEIFNEAGESVGRLMLTVPGENTTLVKLDNGMYQAVAVQDDQNENQEPQLEQVEGAQLIQGSLELSNVNMSLELTTYMEVQRAFQTCSSALQIIDRMNQKSCTQIASI